MIPLRDEDAPAAPPYVTYALSAACCAVYGWQCSLDEAGARHAVVALGAIPAVLLTDARLPPDFVWVPRYATPFTSMFLHAGWLHLLGNMLFLWIFGNGVEHAMGHLRFLTFYLVCGVAALFSQALGDPHSAYPIIGASGSISGVLGAYLALFPRARVVTLVLLPLFFTTLPVPAMLLLLVWFAAQLLRDAAASGGAASIAFRAHIGGFLTGLALVPLWKRRGVRLLAR